MGGESIFDGGAHSTPAVGVEIGWFRGLLRLSYSPGEVKLSRLHEMVGWLI